MTLLFINEFEDKLTSKRRELLNLYGADFVALPEYKSFIHNRGALMIAHLRLNEGKADWFQSDLQMMALYKMLRKGKSFKIQSNIIKAERVAIESNTASMLAKLIQEHFAKLRVNVLRLLGLATVANVYGEHMENLGAIVTMREMSWAIDMCWYFYDSACRMIRDIGSLSEGSERDRALRTHRFDMRRHRRQRQSAVS